MGVVDPLVWHIHSARYAYEFCGKLLKASGLSEANVKQLAHKIETDELATASQRLVDCFNAAKLD